MINSGMKLLAFITEILRWNVSQLRLWMLSLQTMQVNITTAAVDNKHSIHYGNLMLNYVSTDVSSCIGCMALTDRPGKALFSP